MRTSIDDGVAGAGLRWELISQKVFIKSFCKGQFPHKSVKLSLHCMIKETDLCGHQLLQSNFINTACEIRAERGGGGADDDSNPEVTTGVPRS